MKIKHLTLHYIDGKWTANIYFVTGVKLQHIYLGRAMVDRIRILFGIYELQRHWSSDHMDSAPKAVIIIRSAPDFVATPSTVTARSTWSFPRGTTPP